MASGKEYLNFILEQLSGLEDVSWRAMMGEYVLYYRGKVIGGIYDDRFLVKPTPSVLALMPDAERELPYEGAKEMLLVDRVDDPGFLEKLLTAMEAELPAARKKNERKRRPIMRLDGFGLLVNDMAGMIRFYRDVLGFEIKEPEDASNVYLVKDGTLFLLYGRKDFEKLTNHRYDYVKGLNGHSEIALYVDTFEEVDASFRSAVKKGAAAVLEPATEPWGQRTCYIADPEGNLIEIGSWNRPYEEKDS